MSGRETEGASFREHVQAFARECVALASIALFVGAWVAIAGGLA